MYAIRSYYVRKAEGAADLSEYLPVTRKGIDPLWRELQRIVSGVKDPDLSP